MSVAFDEARAAAARGEVPVGAVIVKDGGIVACAGNRPRELRDPSAHAEMLAIRQACEALDDERLSGCDLYVTLEPYYAAYDPKGGAVDNGVRFFDQPTCHHAPEVYGGLR